MSYPTCCKVQMKCIENGIALTPWEVIGTDDQLNVGPGDLWKCRKCPNHQVDGFTIKVTKRD